MSQLNNDRIKRMKEQLEMLPPQLRDAVYGKIAESIANDIVEALNGGRDLAANGAAETEATAVPARASATPGKQDRRRRDLALPEMIFFEDDDPPIVPPTPVKHKKPVLRPDATPGEKMAWRRSTYRFDSNGIPKVDPDWIVGHPVYQVFAVDHYRARWLCNVLWALRRDGLLPFSAPRAAAELKKMATSYTGPFHRVDGDVSESTLTGFLQNGWVIKAAAGQSYRYGLRSQLGERAARFYLAVLKQFHPAYVIHEVE